MVGRRVQITGLTKTPEFNGQWGKAFAKKTKIPGTPAHFGVRTNESVSNHIYTLKLF